MLHAASLIHASGTFVCPIWLRGGAVGGAARLRAARRTSTAIPRWRVTHRTSCRPCSAVLFQTPRRRATPTSRRSRRSSTAPRRCRGRCSSGRSSSGGRGFVQYYGQTEAPLCICRARGRRTTHGPSGCSPAAGRAVDCEIRLVDEDGDEAGDRRDRSCARRSLLTGYFGDAELHRPTFLADGWLRTRDVGRFDEEGYLYLVDRTSRHDRDRRLQRLSARGRGRARRPSGGRARPPSSACPTTSGSRRSPPSSSARRRRADGASSIAHCRERLAGYKVPKAVRFVDDDAEEPGRQAAAPSAARPLWAGQGAGIRI